MRRLTTFLALVGLLLMINAGPAAAHNVPVDSDPPDGASLDTGPARVSVAFDLPVQPGFTVMTVTGPDGNQWQAGPPVEDGAVVSVPLQELGPAGVYVVGYQVLSADSHPVRGTVQFTLTTPGPGTATPPPATGDDAASDDDTASDGDTGNDGSDIAAQPGAEPGSGDTPVWPWLVGAGVLLVAGVAVALRVSRSG